jgi:hypothetical protein
MPPASSRTQRKRPGDLTGVRGQQLAAQAAREKEETKTQVARALDDETREKRRTEVDYSTGVGSLTRVTSHNEAGELEVEDIEVEVPTRRIRVMAAIDDMTFGRQVVSPGIYDERGTMLKAPELGSLNTHSFEEGRWYTVDAELADHLEFLGYTYGD